MKRYVALPNILMQTTGNKRPGVSEVDQHKLRTSTEK